MRLAPALLALSLFASEPLVAHPMGKGFLSLYGNFLVKGQAQEGMYLANGSIPIQDVWRNESGGTLGGTLVVPLGSAFGGMLSGNRYGWTSTQKAEADPPYSALYEERITGNGSNLSLGLWIWPSEFGPSKFMDARDGNPDGVLMWPVLDVGFNFHGNFVGRQLTKKSGGFSGATSAPDLSYKYTAGWVELGLPVHRFYSFFGGFSRNLAHEEVQGVYQDRGQGQYWNYWMGFNLFLPTALKEPEGPSYFAGYGFPGDLKVELSYNQTYYLPTSERVAENLDLALAGAFNNLLALRAAYLIESDRYGYLDGAPSFQSRVSDLTEHSITLTLIMSFAGLMERL